MPHCILTVLPILILFNVLLPSCTGAVLMFGNTSSPYVAYGHENGLIVSPNYPDFMPPRDSSIAPCSLTIVACASCRIRLNFTHLWTHWMPSCISSRASQGSCIVGCDHLYIDEPDNVELTFQYITPSNVPHNATFVSKTRMLYLRFCQSTETSLQQKKFAFSYDIIEKSKIYYGSSTDSGQFTSLGFPQRYSSNGDIFVYYLYNNDSYGRVRLSFDDWNISPFSSIIIYPDGIRNSSSTAVRATGSHPRPFVVSRGQSLVVEFHTATNIDGDLIGFKARFDFIRDTDWSYKPQFVDEFYFSRNFGGSLYSNCLMYSVNDLVDHLWVMPRPSLMDDSAELMLRIIEKTLSGSDYIEIHHGNNSNGELILPDEPHVEYYESTGLYVRLRMRCNWSNKFQAVFAWLQRAVYDGQGNVVCQSEHDVLCADKHYCISSTLRCDGVNHCADGSDERNCTRLLPATSPRAPFTPECSKYFYCFRTQDRVCIDRVCDGVADCSDLTDELNCHHGDNDPFRSYSTLGIVVPIVLVSVILFIVICTVIGYMFQRRRRRTAICQARQLMQHRAALRAAAEAQDMSNPGAGDHLMNGTVSNNISGLPSYEDTIIFNNMAFILSPENVAGENRSLIAPPRYDSLSDVKPDEIVGSVRYVVPSSGQTAQSHQPPAYSSCVVQQELVVPRSTAVPTSVQPAVVPCTDEIQGSVNVATDANTPNTAGENLSSC